QNAVGEIETMVFTAAAAHGILIQHAQTRDCLARIEDVCLGARHLIHILPSHRGDAAHALHQVQDDALAGKNDAGIVANDGDGLALFDTHALEYFRMADDFKAATALLVETREDFEEA